MDDTFSELYKQNLSDDEMISLVEKRVAELLETEPELLMSYMYRLDVLEPDIKMAMQLNKNSTIANAFATLIWKRQKMRIQTRKQFSQDPIEDWEYE